MPRKGPPALTPLRGKLPVHAQPLLQPWQKGYKYIGGRGVRVAKEWWTFASFLRIWKLRGFQELDFARHNVARDYCPANCYWRKG